MESINHYTGSTVPIMNDNIDTDQILPKDFLKRIEKVGFGRYLFQEWRYLDNHKNNPDFILNQPDYKKATILITGDNFGCGSSREHAVWAISNYGFRVVIAGSYGDIFYMNSIKNGLLPIVLPEADRKELAALKPSDSIKVELNKQKIITDQKTYSFSIERKWRDKLINGQDDIDETMEFVDLITKYEKAHNI